MKKSVIIAVLSLGVVFAGLAQNKSKGPAYKNAKASEKHAGTSTVLVKEDPKQFQGPEFKNLNKRQYEIEILEPLAPINSNDLVASVDSTLYTLDDNKEKIIYRRVETKNMKGKNTLKLKGPAYKNHKRQ